MFVFTIKNEGTTGVDYGPNVEWKRAFFPILNQNVINALYTVNSKIFMRVLFSQNFAKTLTKWQNHFVVY